MENFADEANGLVHNSKYSERMQKLLLKKEPGNGITSFGALLYVLGHHDIPARVDAQTLQKFIQIFCEQGKEPDGIVVFNSIDEIVHCGLYLSQIRGEDIMFHKSKAAYDVSPVSCYLESALGITELEYYHLRKNIFLDLPDKATGKEIKEHAAIAASRR
ncbi:hypothetical protein KY308_02875 [Candidatus Woesearchaeota archaeon]|nr:hypothetical protein [Candidatus Woesearchaeota archaeon]